MITTPFTFVQASAICRDYQHLCGRIMDQQVLGKGYIECVAVAPYETAKKWLFAQFYRDNRDPVKALQFYKGNDYDVIVLSLPLLRKRGIFFTDLHTYALEQHIPFDPFHYERFKGTRDTRHPVSRFP